MKPARIDLAQPIVSSIIPERRAATDPESARGGNGRGGAAAKLAGPIFVAAIRREAENRLGRNLRPGQ